MGYTVPDEKYLIPLENRKLSHELFEKVTHGEYIDYLVDHDKYLFIKPKFKFNHITDMDILDLLGRYSDDNILHFLNPFGDVYIANETIIFIDGVPLDLIDNNYTSLTNGNYIYVYSKKLQKYNINKIEVMMGRNVNVIDKKITNRISLVEYTDDFLRLRINPSGNVFTTLYNDIALEITIRVKHYLLDANSIISDYNKIFSKDAICVGVDNKLTCDASITKINKFTIKNDTTAKFYVPYVDDVYDKSYYESFYSRFISTSDKNSTESIIKPLNLHIRNMKCFIDHFSSYYSDYLENLYKYDMGVYEKLTLEKSYKKIYNINSIGGIDGDFKLTKNLYGVQDNYFKEEMLYFSVPNINDTDSFEVYMNNLFLHDNITRYYHHDKVHFYIPRQVLYSYKIKDYLLKHNICDMTDVIYSSEEDMWNRYKNVILNNTGFAILRKRKDYRRYETGCGPHEKNVIKLPRPASLANGVSIFANGCRLQDDDYYVEIIGGFNCIVLKRKYDTDYITCTITYYVNPIYMSKRQITYSKLFENVMSSDGDEIYIDGILLTQNESYTPDSTCMITTLKTNHSVDEDSIIEIVSYKDKVIYNNPISDYRYDLRKNLLLDDVISSAYNTLTIRDGKPRKHDKLALEEYIFYLKYMVCGEYENLDVYGVIEDIPDMTEEHLDAIKVKYTSLFENEKLVVYQGGIDKDFPQDLEFGTTETVMDETLASYLETEEALVTKHLGKPYISIVEDDEVVYDMNYIGQHLIKK